MQMFTVTGPGGRHLGRVRAANADAAASLAMRRPWRDGPAMRVQAAERPDPYRDPAQHPGRACSPCCALYGCAGWTGVERRADRRWTA